MWFKHTIEGHITKRDPSLEPFIIQSPKDSYFYCKQILRKPWDKAEKIILTDPKYTYLYAKNVLKKRWRKGETFLLSHVDACNQNNYGSYWKEQVQESVILYLKHVVKDRWESVESFILNSCYIGTYLNLIKDEKQRSAVARKITCEAIIDNPTAKKFLEWKPTHSVKMVGSKAFDVLLDEKKHIIHPYSGSSKTYVYSYAFKLEEWLNNSGHGLMRTDIEYSHTKDSWYWKRHAIYNLEKHKLKGTVTPLGQK